MTTRQVYYRKNRLKYLAYNAKWESKNKKTRLLIQAARRQRYRLRLLDLKKKGKCQTCGIADYRVMEFAHKRGIKKTSDFSIGKGWKTLEKELKKCILLCANCHILYDWRKTKERHELQRRLKWKIKRLKK